MSEGEPAARRDVLLQAPCKLNLFLEVLAKRPDGYHEVETLLVAVSLYDTVWVAPSSPGTVELVCGWASGYEAARLSSPWAESSWESLPLGPDNLAYRAVDDLRRQWQVTEGVRVTVYKRIPIAAGLGGASTDAAAALTGAACLWGMAHRVAELRSLAERLGSDVAFFLGRAAAVGRGRGEHLESLPRVPRYDFVVVRPPVGLSTGQVYRQCRPARQPRRVEEAVSAFLSGDPIRLGRALYNRLQEAAEQMTPWIGKLRAMFDRCGFTGYQMSGSGSSFFGVCRHARHARWAAGRLRAMGVGAVFHVTTHPNQCLRAGGPAEGDAYGNHRGSHQAHGEHG